MEIKSLEGLKKQIKTQEEELNVLTKNWAQEVKLVSSEPDFDVYSKKGEKKLDQVAEKFAPLIVDAQDKLNELIDEYNSYVKEDDKIAKPN